MLGTIDLLFLMMLKVWLNFLEDKNLSLKNLRNFSLIANTGLLCGFPILTTGLEISMIFSLFGFLVLLIDLISLPNSAEWFWTHNMGHKEMVYQEMMTTQRCQLGISLQLSASILSLQLKLIFLAVQSSAVQESIEEWIKISSFLWIYKFSKTKLAFMKFNL